MEPLEHQFNTRRLNPKASANRVSGGLVLEDNRTSPPSHRRVLEDNRSNVKQLLAKNTPDERKAAAIAELKSTFASKPFDKSTIDKELATVKEQFSLSKAIFNPKEQHIALYASPATFLPTAPFIPYTGIKGALLFGGAPTKAIKAGDYIKATRVDGPFDVPAADVTQNINNRFGNQPYRPGLAAALAAGLMPPAIKKKLPANIITQNQTLLRTKNVAPKHRAGQVEAQSSVPRGPKRSGNGETLFGWMGRDEEKILTGGNTVTYNGGHLVGDQIMDGHKSFDMYKDWNLAPQERGFNSPVYTTRMETPVTNAIKAGAGINYHVQVGYPNSKYAIRPSVLIANLWPVGNPHRTTIEDAIAGNAALDNDLYLIRRTPGWWRAIAKVIPGTGTINSGNIRHRAANPQTANQAQVAAHQPYVPGMGEQGRYTLQVDQGNHNKTLASPKAGAAINYNNAISVALTARQQTF